MRKNTSPAEGTDALVYQCRLPPSSGARHDAARRPWRTAVILNPPSLGPAKPLPHWPYLQAVDDALTRRGIPPGTVRADYRHPRFGDRLFIVLGWDTSRTAARTGGIRFDWDEDTGWAYALHGLHLRSATSRPLTVLHRVYAAPDEVASVAEQFVCHGRLPTGEYGGEWEEGNHVRATIERFRATLRDPEGLWTGGG